MCEKSSQPPYSFAAVVVDALQTAVGVVLHSIKHLLASLRDIWLPVYLGKDGDLKTPRA